LRRVRYHVPHHRAIGGAGAIFDRPGVEPALDQVGQHQAVNRDRQIEMAAQGRARHRERRGLARIPANEDFHFTSHVKPSSIEHFGNACTVVIGEAFITSTPALFSCALQSMKLSPQLRQ